MGSVGVQLESRNCSSPGEGYPLAIGPMGTVECSWNPETAIHMEPFSIAIVCNAASKRATRFVDAKPEQRPFFRLVMQRTGSGRNYDINKVP